MQDMLDMLQASARERMLRAYAPKSKGTLRSAIRKLGQFAASIPKHKRELFCISRHTGDRQASSHNEWTFVLFVEWMLQTISAKTGKPLSSSTIETYVSLLKGYLIFSYDFEIPAESPRLKRLIAMIRSEDPLAGARRKRRGFRRRHLIQLWRLKGRACAAEPDAATKLAALATAWIVLARGGELCTCTRADLEFHVLRNGVRYAILWLRPLKKRGTAPAAKVPQYVQEADGGGADAYMLLRRMVELDFVPMADRASTPLFRLKARKGKGHRTITVAHLRKFTRDCAAVVGFRDGKQWGAHSARIGGATDLASTGKVSQLLLQAKGRWGSDIGRIYARMTRRCHLAASRLMHEARGRDLEEIHPDFTQGV